MSVVKISSTGDFRKSRKLLNSVVRGTLFRDLNKYGQEGVDALSKATPVDTGKTASSWDYKITHGDGKISIVWTNSNVVDGVPIAIIIQYGHATNNGGWVEGRDYINPALKPVFDKILKNVWEEVTK